MCARRHGQYLQNAVGQLNGYIRLVGQAQVHLFGPETLDRPQIKFCAAPGPDKPEHRRFDGGDSRSGIVRLCIRAFHSAHRSYPWKKRSIGTGRVTTDDGRRAWPRKTPCERYPL